MRYPLRLRKVLAALVAAAGLVGSVSALAQLPPPPAAAGVPAAPAIPGAAGFRGGYSPPGFFTLKGDDDPASVRGLYTAPVEQEFFGRTNP